jgi:Zn-dependent protease
VDFSIPAEPFAAVAFVAALVGFSLVFVRVTTTRLLGASIAGAAGTASLVLLALSPTLRALGLSAVTLLYGFWITLAMWSGHWGTRSPAAIQHYEFGAPQGTVT